MRWRMGWFGSGRSASGTASAMLAGMFLAVSLAGCVTTQQTGSANVPSGPVLAGSDQTDPEHRARVQLELASAYFGRGASDIALDNVRQALVIKPDYGDALNLRGLILASLGDPKNAEDSFHRALQVNPADADTMHNLGWFLCQQRRYDEAQAQFNQALAQTQYRGTVRTLLAEGVCQAKSGNMEEAERTLLHAYELDPSSPTTAINLSEVMYRRGELERARFYIARVNNRPDQSNAQTLWLATRIENKAGNMKDMQAFADQLRSRFPESPEALALERGRFDE